MKVLSFVVTHFDKLVEIKSRKQLTTVVSRLSSLYKSYEFNQEELDAFHAPSECYEDVYRSFEHEAKAIVKDEGFINFDVLIKVVTNRTTSRWFYSSNLSSFSHMREFK